MERLALPSRFVLLQDQGQTRALGLAVVRGSLMTFYNLRVAPDQRRKGYGRAVMQHLLAWGQRLGAQRAVLQVMRDNPPALGLYAALGFREIYGYWYRRHETA